MNNKKVVITGIGVIASNGIGKDAFWSAIFNGESGINPVTLFDSKLFQAKQAGEIKDFDASVFLGPKGHRTFDRSTKLIVSAAKLALDDAGLVMSEDNAYDAGVVVGSTLGSVSSVSDFDKDALLEGPQYVNPAFFPNTVINSPASQVSIKFGIKGFNTTISTGFCASMDALNYAADFIRLNRAKMVLAGGVEEFCVQTFLGFEKAGCLAGLDGQQEVSSPFDKRRNGMVLGEGACFLVLEDSESALRRNARIIAQVNGYGRGFDLSSMDGFDPAGTGMKKAMREALSKSNLSAADVQCVLASAHSGVIADRLEASALNEVFGPKNLSVKVSAIKSMIGETYSASGAFGVASALGAIMKQAVPPTANYLEQDSSCAVNVSAVRQEASIENVLVNSFGTGGCNASLIVSKFNG